MRKVFIALSVQISSIYSSVLSTIQSRGYNRNKQESSCGQKKCLSCVSTSKNNKRSIFFLLKNTKKKFYNFYCTNKCTYTIFHLAVSSAHPPCISFGVVSSFSPVWIKKKKKHGINDDGVCLDEGARYC